MRKRKHNKPTLILPPHSIILLILAVCLLQACGGGRKKSKSSSRDTLVTDSVPVNYNPNQKIEKVVKPVFTVRNNYIDWDSISPYFMINYYSDNLEKLSLFYGIKYNDSYEQIAFSNNELVIDTDTLRMYHEQRIIGCFMTDSSIKRNIEYLIIHDSGDYSEEIDLISISSKGKIIDFIELMSSGGDGGDNYEKRLKRIDNNNYKIRDLAIHRTDTDTMLIDRDIIYRITFNVDGTISKKELSAKKTYTKIGLKIESSDDWENLWSNF